MAESAASTVDKVATAAASHALAIMGGVRAGDDLRLPGDAQTLLLLGPREPGFWAHFTAQPEYGDGAADPIDRWSTRVVRALADQFGARAIFPFGGAPFHPFQAWALASKRSWTSPVQFLVHDEAGLMVSFRGALAFDAVLDLPPPPAHSPCETCTTRPCLSACPVGALGAHGYDLAWCRTFLDSPRGPECMTRGCAVRRACPVSIRHGREPAHSAFYMRAFHP